MLEIFCCCCNFVIVHNLVIYRYLCLFLCLEKNAFKASIAASLVIKYAEKVG